MELFLYTYLNKKYGLKALVIEWANAIVNGIKAFSSIDSEIILFGKILKNQCDEDFRHIQAQVRFAMMDIIKEKLRKKHKNKGEGEINTMIKCMQESDVEEWIWVELVERMYNKEHSHILIDIINSFITTKKDENDRNSSRHFTREEITKMQNIRPANSIGYSDLLKILLDFQLKSHENYLKKFVDLFKRVDQGTHGMITEQQLRLILTSMNVNNGKAVDEILLKADPFNLGKITFSDAIKALANTNSSTSMSILEAYITQ